MPKIVAQDKNVPCYRIGGHYFSKDLSMDEAFKISSSIMVLGDNEGNFTKRVGKQGYPLTIVVDKDGIVRYCKNGTNDDIRSEILQVVEKWNKL